MLSYPDRQKESWLLPPGLWIPRMDYAPKGRTELLDVQLFGLSQVLHQPRLAPGCVVPVNNALLGRLIQGTGGLQRHGLSLLELTSGNQCTGLFDKGACPRAMHLIDFAPPLRGADAFDG